MANELPTDEFASWRSFWRFERAVNQEYRYFRSPEVDAFLQTVGITSQSRKVVIDEGNLFWRAALDHDWRSMDSESDEEIPCAHPPKRMKPLVGRASDGRANPRGIPCLYMATTKEAAMCEVRPWVGSYVSVGRFRTNRPLTVVDCSRRPDASPFYFNVEDFNYEPSAEDKSEATWTFIDKAFARPMTRTDDQAAYVPTQILAELFKQTGFDGVVYKSNFGEDGYNIALFDPDAADLVECGLFEVKGIQATFSQADTFYTVSQKPSADPADDGDDGAI